MFKSPKAHYMSAGYLFLSLLTLIEVDGVDKRRGAKAFEHPLSYIDRPKSIALIVCVQIISWGAANWHDK